MLGFKSFLMNEDLPTRMVDKEKFPNPLPRSLAKDFLNKGLEDGQSQDDRIRTQTVTIPAARLKPSQTAVYLSKCLGMAIGGVKGGNLGSIVSADDYILDGHHRWGATMINQPTAAVTGIRVMLPIGDLIPILRAVGDAFGNQRRGEPSGGDKNIFEATDKDIVDAMNGKGMDPRFWSKDKAEMWLKDLGGISVLKDRIKIIQRTKPPAGAPPRIQMPVIDAEKGEHIKAANALMVGKIDIRKPYAK